jgi:methionine-rich copper-binding protein CopC
MKIAKKLSRVVIALAMCMLLVVTAWAANEIFVTYSATLDDSVLCVNELEKTITLTVAANKTVDGDITMDSLTAQVKLPEIPEGQKGPTLAAISNSDLGFTDSNYNLENGMILWYSGNAESVKNEQLANVSINVPAGTPAGTYEIVFEIIDISRDYGMSWENGTTVTATLTVAGHSDGDDNDHECDYCGGYVEGATCTYVPDEYVWSEDNSTCTVVGTCACGKSATANATVTPSVTAATCMTEEKTTYTAVFDETWAENQTKADVVTGDIDPNNHTGNNHI